MTTKISRKLGPHISTSENLQRKLNGAENVIPTRKSSKRSVEIVMQNISFKTDDYLSQLIFDRLEEANENTRTPVSLSELIRRSLEFSFKYPLSEVIT